MLSSLQGGLAASSIYCRACRYFHGHGSSFLTIKHFQMWHKLFLIFTSVLMRVQAKRRFSVLKSWVILFQKYRPMFECKNQKIMCKMIKFFVMLRERAGQKELKNKKIMFTKFRFFLPAWLKHISFQFPSRRTCGQFELLQGESLLPWSCLLFF